MNTFGSLCISACVFMIFIGFGFGFVSAIGAFPISKTAPFDTGDTTSDVLSNLSSNITGAMGSITSGQLWAISTGLTIAGSVAFSILTGTTNVIGIWLFGSFFWSAWGSLVIIFAQFDFLKTGAGAILVTMITVGMAIMFYGAVIGMLSGSTSMK